MANKLIVRCPVCASTDVFYTCEPRCCFNHVCNACKTSFLTATEATGGKIAGLKADVKESGDPAARCCNCRSIDVVTTSDGAAACASCGAALKLTYLDIETR